MPDNAETTTTELMLPPSSMMRVGVQHEMRHHEALTIRGDVIRRDAAPAIEDLGRQSY